MSITAIDTVCTDADLITQFGGEEAFGNVLPDGQPNAQPQRQVVFDRALTSLKNREPPVRETELVDVTELRQTVVYGAIAELCWAAMTETGDRWEKLAKRYDGLYQSELSALRPSVAVGQTAGTMSISIHRR